MRSYDEFVKVAVFEHSRDRYQYMIEHPLPEQLSEEAGEQYNREYRDYMIKKRLDERRSKLEKKYRNNRNGSKEWRDHVIEAKLKKYKDKLEMKPDMRI